MENENSPGKQSKSERLQKDPQLLSSENPPEEVDMARIEAFHRNELDADEANWVAYLISHFTTWNQAELVHLMKAADGPEEMEER